MLCDDKVCGAFFCELEKIAKGPGFISGVKKFLGTTEGRAAGIAGVGAVGLGFIDTRQKPNLDKVPKIEATWETASKYTKPGDVIIGANRPPNFKSYGIDFVERYKQHRKSGAGILNSLKSAGKSIPISAISSKVGDPRWSHAFIVGPDGTSIYGGGKGLVDITKEDIPATRAHLKEQVAKGAAPHYIVLRPRAGVSQLQRIRDAEKFEKIVEPVAGGRKDYRAGRTTWDQISEWITPKTNSRYRSFKKSKAVIEAEKNMVGGNCATTAAIFSNKAIVGKSSENVLPHDFLYSRDYKPVVMIGDKPKVNPLTYAAYRIPEVAARTLAGAAAAGAAFGGVKGFKALAKSKLFK
jgi:hypothetical protein